MLCAILLFGFVLWHISGLVLCCFFFLFSYKFRNASSDLKIFCSFLLDEKSAKCYKNLNFELMVLFGLVS